jgi:peptidoglycan/xylan/chitin deacetylase (PgdA/CDA1 family)
MLKESMFMALAIKAMLGIEHLPEDRLYVPRVDTGYEQYDTPSLHKTNQYVLTFDDGPHPKFTAQILDLLKKHKVKATFFILTHKLNNKTFPIFKRILDEGHTASSHNHYHDYSDRLDEQTFRNNLKQSFIKLKEFYERAGHKMDTFYFRFPYAQYGGHKYYHHMNIIKEVSDELFGKNCIHFAFWDIDSSDWVPGLTGKEVFENIKAYHEGGKYISYKLIRQNGRRTIVKNPISVNNPLGGGVILQHDIQYRTIEGTKRFLEYAQANHIGIRHLPTVDEFSYQGLDCKFK